MNILDQQHIPKFIIYRHIMILDFYVRNVSFLNHNNIPALPNISPSTAFCSLPQYIIPHKKVMIAWLEKNSNLLKKS